MKNGRVGVRVASKFQAEFGGPPILKFGVSRRFAQVVGSMLLGAIIAGPNLPLLHAQDSRLAKTSDTKSPKSLAGRETTPPKESASISSTPKTVQSDIVLPDIFIPVPGTAVEFAAPSPAPIDTAKIKQQLQKAESELKSLQRERERLLKNLEQQKTRSVKGVNRSAVQRTELLERPSV
jgi:hypothetical protein